MHPRERPTTRRQFLIRAGMTVGALSGADALLSACGGAAQSSATTGNTSGVLMGPGGIPLARRDHPVTLPLYGDNPVIASGKDLEAGPLELEDLGSVVVRAGERRATCARHGRHVTIVTLSSPSEA